MAASFFQRLFAPERPAASTFAAEVGHEPALVALYDAEGHEIRVRPAEVADWRSRGFAQTPFDLGAARQELRPRFVALDAAFATLVAQAEAGLLEPADLAVAQLAAGRFAGSLERILIAAQLAYPLREPEPLVLVDPEGATHQIDPGQAALYRAKGFREVRGG